MSSNTKRQKAKDRAKTELSGFKLLAAVAGCSIPLVATILPSWNLIRGLTVVSVYCCYEAWTFFGNLQTAIDQNYGYGKVTTKPEIIKLLGRRTLLVPEILNLFPANKFEGGLEFPSDDE